MEENGINTFKCILKTFFSVAYLPYCLILFQKDFLTEKTFFKWKCTLRIELNFTFQELS